MFNGLKLTLWGLLDCVMYKRLKLKFIIWTKLLSESTKDFGTAPSKTSWIRSTRGPTPSRWSCTSSPRWRYRDNDDDDDNLTMLMMIMIMQVSEQFWAYTFLAYIAECGGLWACSWDTLCCRSRTSSHSAGRKNNIDK